MLCIENGSDIGN